jgi:hypothetical protein
MDDDLIFVNLALDNGGKIEPLILPAEESKGLGLCNPSVYIHNNKILLNLRQLNYVLFHAEMNRHEHIWGPLCYLNPENDIKLRTTNYLCYLDDDLQMTKYIKVDTTGFDREPLWEFIGLEDARLFVWDEKMFLCGVRRDTTTHGEGRMELSEIVIKDNTVTEISRTRIPAPGKNDSYCEKNWMPILDHPYHWVKWSNPTEVVKFDPASKTTVTTKLGKYYPLDRDLRGASQVIPFLDGYLTLTHETFLYRSERDLKDATYRHRFILWDKNFNVVKFSNEFSFMGAKIEFCCGMAEYNDTILITFGYQDNAAFIMQAPKNFIIDFINA